MSLEGVSNFTNIDSEDFEGMYGGDRAVVKSGKTVAFPTNIAKHLAGQLATKILKAMDVDWNSDARRPGIIAEILGEEPEEADDKTGTITPMKAISKEEVEETKEDAGEETEETPEAEGEFEDLEKEKSTAVKSKDKSKTKAKKKK